MKLHGDTFLSPGRSTVKRKREAEECVNKRLMVNSCRIEFFLLL
jgi:hypothetical protein